MYAIIATGGKQYKVAEGDVIKVERPVSYTHLGNWSRNGYYQKSG